MKNRLTKRHSLRPRDWRKQRVLYYLSKRKRPQPEHEDPLTLALFDFFADVLLCQRGREKYKLMSRKPHLWQAFEIYGDHQSDLKGILEARILSGDTTERIADKLGIPSETIEAYLSCFFDVRDRLGSADYIHSEILKSDGCDDERGDLLRLVGYCAGPEALDLILRSATPTASPGDRNPTQELSDCIDAQILERTITSIGKMDASNLQSMRAILQAYARHQAASAEEATLSPGHESYQKHVEACLKGITWSLASKNPSPELQSWSKTAYELRAHEQLRVAAGETLENEEELRNIRAPDDR